MDTSPTSYSVLVPAEVTCTDHQAPLWGVSSSQDENGYRDGHTPTLPRSTPTPAGQAGTPHRPESSQQEGRSRHHTWTGEWEPEMIQKSPLYEPFLQTLR